MFEGIYDEKGQMEVEDGSVRVVCGGEEGAIKAKQGTKKRKG